MGVTESKLSSFSRTQQTTTADAVSMREMQGFMALRCDVVVNKQLHKNQTCIAEAHISRDAIIASFGDEYADTELENSIMANKVIPSSIYLSQHSYNKLKDVYPQRMKYIIAAVYNPITDESVNYNNEIQSNGHGMLPVWIDEAGVEKFAQKFDFKLDCEQ